MSRIGNNPITVPADVNLTIESDSVVVKGPKGELQQDISQLVKIVQDGDQLAFTRTNDEKEARALHGLTRSLVANMIEGVTKGFTKKLEINGVGYKAAIAGKKLTLNLGFSHPIEYIIADGVDVSVEENTQITVSGFNKQQVGQVAAEIRAFKKPEPYKGKGIKYEDEVVQRKAGKAAAAGEGA